MLINENISSGKKGLRQPTMDHSLRMPDIPKGQIYQCYFKLFLGMKKISSNVLNTVNPNKTMTYNIIIKKPYKLV